MVRRNKIFAFSALVVVFLAIFFAFSREKENREPAKTDIAGDPAGDSQPEKIAETEQPEPAPEKIAEEAPEKSDSALPEKFLLDIPFYSQAPFSRWDSFDEDMCEEASVLNAAYRLLGKKPSKEEYEKELQKMQVVEKREIGEWKSTTVAETKKLVDIYFEGEIQSKIIDNPTVDEIQAEIAAGRPVVVPLAGREIGNPNFTPPGPIYHMLVVKGYDARNFVTNDVGTRKGNSYVYKKSVIMENMHDWNEKDIHLGVSRILVLFK